jgi:Meckel syndrome type 1 protein
VPPPPISATSTAERQKLTQTLVAERTDTQSNVAAPPGPLAPAASGQPAPAPSSRGTAPATAAPGPAASAAPGKTARGTPASGNHKANEPPEPLPLESSLQMPEVRSVPEPEKPRPPLPAPQLQTTPARVVAAVPPPPEAIASATPEPAPPVPVMAEVPPPPSLPRPQSRRPAPVIPVAALEMPGAAPRLDGNGRAQVERVAALYREQPRPVRVVAYTSPPAPGALGGEPLGSYHAALARAQAVADALRAAGIPADKLQAEAAPAASAGSADRVDIQFAP